jgi:spermidine synthase
LSNVSGALAGAVVPLFLIELYGFHATLRIGLLLNFVIAGSAITLSLRSRETTAEPEESVKGPFVAHQAGGNGDLVLLFLTGCTTMGMEVVWIRLFTPYIGPLVYSFAAILACYLLATSLGSLWYRSESRRGSPQNHLAWVMLAFAGLIALFAADPRVLLSSVQRICIGIGPFSLLIGFLTPMLVDRWSGGDPDRAGRAYAVNVVGCIIGPLLSGFVLLPIFGGQLSMLLYSLPWMAMALIPPKGESIRVQARIAALGIVASSCVLFLLTKSYETIYPVRRVLRDSTATVIATGAGMAKTLITNGIRMTMLTPITKMMAHLTLASLDHEPRSVLVICFGMGTTYRSVASWGTSETVAELVPSVPRLFSFYHEDGDSILASPQSHVVIDDGRRFMERSRESFDAIIIDPPPPVHSAASSLLYSEEFYAVAKQRLGRGGIMQQWLPNGDKQIQASVAKALAGSFPYVRVYRSIRGWGWHFLASMSPIPERTAAELVARMPPAAVKDMMEWGPGATPVDQFQRMLSAKMTLEELVREAPATPPMQDDRPVNEYFLLRELAQRIK